MIDRISATARLALRRARVDVPQPSFVQELLLVVIVLLCIAWAVAVVNAIPLSEELLAAQREARHWKAKAEQPFQGVRLDPYGLGYRCQTEGVRREWEKVIAAKCEELGGLLLFARTIP